MLFTHLGTEVNIDPRQATVENRIVRMLYKHRAGVRQNRLLQLTSSGRLGAAVFEEAVRRLADEAGLLTRSTTNHERGFVLQLTTRGEVQAQALEETLARQNEPLRPEAA